MTTRINDCVIVLPLTIVQKSVLHGLIKHADYVTGKDAWPRVQKLAQYASVSDRAVQGALKALVQGHWISQQAPAGHLKPTTYHVHFDRIRVEAARIEAEERHTAAQKRMGEPRAPMTSPDQQDQDFSTGKGAARAGHGRSTFGLMGERAADDLYPCTSDPRTSESDADASGPSDRKAGHDATLTPTDRSPSTDRPTVDGHHEAARVGPADARLPGPAGDDQADAAAAGLRLPDARPTHPHPTPARAGMAAAGRLHDVGRPPTQPTFGPLDVTARQVGPQWGRLVEALREGLQARRQAAS